MILVVNAGSSSIKFAVFSTGLAPLTAGMVSGIGSARGEVQCDDDRVPASVADHDAALTLMQAALTRAGFPLEAMQAAAHRVVHGGATLTAPAPVSPKVIEAIRACAPLAPLHNPHNLAGIAAVARLRPDLPQSASFDTAFHATNGALATTYPLPKAERAAGLRRYGFHGLSYAAMVAHFGADLPARLLAFHLGNGASLCAIHDGRSVATSMGYSPLDGLVMGTRSGAIDGMAVLRLARDHGIDGAERLLNRDSGLLALGGTNDMRALLASDTDEARFAVAHFCYWAARHAASAICAMGGVDAVAFTGGIGENAGAVRARIMEHLAWLGPLPVHVVPAEEERQIARDAVQVLGLT